LSNLHGSKFFEVFTNFEQKKDKTSKTPRLFPSTISTINFSDLHRQNSEKIKRGIWFTPNSLKGGKRSKVTVTHFNAVGLDTDFTGSRAEQEQQKEEYLTHILNIQLPPTVIIESKRGLQPL